MDIILKSYDICLNDCLYTIYYSPDKSSSTYYHKITDDDGPGRSMIIICFINTFKILDEFNYYKIDKNIIEKILKQNIHIVKQKDNIYYNCNIYLPCYTTTIHIYFLLHIEYKNII